MSEGSIIRRGKTSWRLKFEAGHDDTGKRVTKYATYRGTKAGAQTELRRLLGQVDACTYTDPGKITLGEYMDLWLEGHRASVSPRTVERYGELIRLHIKPSIGSKPLGKLKTLDLNKFYADKLASGRVDGQGGLSPRTVRHLDRVLNTALKDAVKGNLLAINPATHAKRPKVEPKDVETLSDKDFPALLEKAQGGRLYCPLLFILATGVRRGELLALRWRNVSLDAATALIVEAVEETGAGLRIKPPKTKSGRRGIDIPAFAVQALREHQLEQKKEHLALGIGWSVDTLVFPGPTGEVQRPRVFTKAVSRLAKSAGIRFTAHLGRHDHFSRLLSSGVHPKVAQARAGHSSITTTMDIYSHVAPGLQKEAAERMDNAFTVLTR